MTISYKDFIIKSYGIGSFTMNIILDGYTIITRTTGCADIGPGKVYGQEIKSHDDAIKLGKEIIDRHSQKLLLMKRKKKDKRLSISVY